MSKKYLVFSVYSPDIEDYPYFPFFGKSVTEGVRLFMKFIESKEHICPNPELHLLGECREFNGSYVDIQPFMFPKRVEVVDNIFGRCCVLAFHYYHKICLYLDRLMLSHTPRKVKK